MRKEAMAAKMLPKRGKHHMTEKSNMAVVVTTAHRGVFFGFPGDGQRLDAKTIRITQARMCIYWSEDIKGVLGLAATGPNANCKVGPAVPAITLQNVISVMEASPEAVKAWAAVVWK